jgi:hypothetical protein
LIIPCACEAEYETSTGSCDDRVARMFGEAAMAELWEGVGKATLARMHKAQEVASGWVLCSHWW